MERTFRVGGIRVGSRLSLGTGVTVTIIVLVGRDDQIGHRVTTVGGV